MIPTRSASLSHSQRLVLALLAFGFVAVESRDLRGPPAAVFHHFEDDAYYNFQVARNVVEGRGMTFDGSSPTNGVHPTVFLTALPVFAATAGDPVQSLRWYGGLMLALHLAVGWRIASFGARRWPGSWWGLALAVWVGSHYFRRFGLAGCDALWSGAFSLAALMAYAEACESPEPRWIRPGLWAALACFSRLDQLALPMALAADTWIGRHRDAGTMGRLILPSVAGVAVMATIQTAWMGHPIPDNGRAIRNITEGVAWYDAHVTFQDRLLTQEEIAAMPHPVPFHQAETLQAGLLHGALTAIMLADAFLHDPFRSASLPNRWLPSMIGSAWIAGVLSFVLAVMIRRRAPPSGWGWALGLYVAGSVAGHLGVVRAGWGFLRYFYPAVVAGWVGLIDALARRTPQPSAALRAVLLGAACLGLAGSWLRPSGLLAFNLRFTDLMLVEWIESHTRPEESVGTFQAGLLAYRTDRAVYDLDGKVSHAALTAYSAQRMDTYARKLGIDWVIDLPFVVNYGLLLRSDHPLPYRLEPVRSFPHLGGVTAYRMVWNPSEDAAPPPSVE